MEPTDVEAKVSDLNLRVKREIWSEGEDTYRLEFEDGAWIQLVFDLDQQCCESANLEVLNHAKMAPGTKVSELKVIWTQDQEPGDVSSCLELHITGEKHFIVRATNNHSGYYAHSGEITSAGIEGFPERWGFGL